ncbi:MAG: hypothetical protein EOR22_06495 [Mesorhizobium sp.]|nr:MAG: hypothetical protein EOR22_06495 [Mesorhizobium sp.]
MQEQATEPSPQDEKLKLELERAYRAIRGFYTAYQNGVPADRSVIAYHSPTIAAACRFVMTGSLYGSEYFIGKPVEVLREAMQPTNVKDVEA